MAGVGVEAAEVTVKGVFAPEAGDLEDRGFGHGAGVGEYADVAAEPVGRWGRSVDAAGHGKSVADYLADVHLLRIDQDGVPWRNAGDGAQEHVSLVGIQVFF